jgi:hypothetical protein
MSVSTSQPSAIPLSSRRSSAGRYVLIGLAFLANVILVEICDAANDIFRGNFNPANPATALHNARQVVSFERRLDFFLEPAWQTYFHQTHTLLGIAITWPRVLLVINNVYAFAHFIVLALVALWVYIRHREHFGLVRNTIIGTILVAGIVYDLYPVSPPWLTPAVLFHGHPYHFVSTMQHAVGGTRLNGHVLGYNPNAAMPSLHISWALIVSACLIYFGRNPLAIAAGLLYPALMLFAIVLTSNHWILDGIAAIPTVLIAGGLAFAARWLWQRRALLRFSPRRYGRMGNRL